LLHGEEDSIKLEARERARWRKGISRGERKDNEKPIMEVVRDQKMKEREVA